MITPERIKKIRGKLPRALFATLVGTSEITVWRWENGGSKPEGAALRLLELLTEHREQTIDHLKGLVEMDFRKST